MPSQSTPLIVTGMHRSGLSLTASLLESSGVKFDQGISLDSSQEKKLETSRFATLQAEILRSQNLEPMGWTLTDTIEINEGFSEKAQSLIQQCSTAQVWGWKEPNTTLFLEFWAKNLPNAYFLLIYRSPWEVVDSIYRSPSATIFKNQPELAIQYVIFYYQKIIHFYNQNSSRCLLANIQTIVRYPQAFITKINQQFNLSLSSTSNHVYDSSLLKTEASLNSYRLSLIDDYFPEATEIYQEMEGRSWHPEQNPDLSWQGLIQNKKNPSLIFQDWLNLRQQEIENQVLRTETKQYQSQLEEAQEELQASKSQVEKTKSLLETAQAQLQKKESVVAKSQSQLQQSQTQLHQAQNELGAYKQQLQQAEWDAKRYQLQLHQTQEELEQSELERDQLQRDLKQLEGKFYQTEIAFNQSQVKLYQTQKKLERTLAQLHQVQPQLEQAERQLLHLSQTEELLQQSQNQLHQTEALLQQSQSQLHATEALLKQYQSQVHQMEEELQQVQTQLHQTQLELSRLRLYESVTEPPVEQDPEMQYKLLVWEAWCAYHNGDLKRMAQLLKQSLEYTAFPKATVVINWLETFVQLAHQQGISLDTYALSNSPEWKQLLRRTVVLSSVKLSV